MLRETDDAFVDLCLKDSETRTRAVLQRESQRRVFLVFSIFLAFIGAAWAVSSLLTDIDTNELTNEFHLFLIPLIFVALIALHLTWELRLLKFAERIAEKQEHSAEHAA